MSHMSTYKQVIKNVRAFLDVAISKGYKVREGEGLVVNQFGSNVVPNAVASVMLPEWKYEVAIDKDGGVIYDHFGAAKNSFDRLGEVIQDYNQSVTMQAAPLYDVANYYTQEKENGDRVLTLEYE